MHICSHCATPFSSKTNLNTHMKTAKYCLKIQGKPIAEFPCKYCHGIFASRKSQQAHENKCPHKETKEISDKLTNENIELKDTADKNEKLTKEIVQLKKRISTLKADAEKMTTLQQEVLYLKNNISDLKQENVRLCIENSKIPVLYQEISDLKQEKMDLLSVMSKTGTKNITNNNTLMLTKAYINTMTPLDLSENTVQNVIDDLVLEDTLHGPDGIARFLKKNLLTDDYEKLKYICTDVSRGSFKYNDICKKLQKDMKCERLFSAIYDPLAEKIHELYQEFFMKTGDYDAVFSDKSLYFDNPEMFKPGLIKSIAKVTSNPPANALHGQVPQKFLV